MLELDREFLKYPEVRAWLYKNGTRPKTVTTDFLEAFFELICDTVEAIWDYRDSFDDDDRISWSKYIVGLLNHDNELRRFLDKKTDDGWYPSLDDLLGDNPLRR